jgi:hypothetical protein
LTIKREIIQYKKKGTKDFSGKFFTEDLEAVNEKMASLSINYLHVIEVSVTYNRVPTRTAATRTTNRDKYCKEMETLGL